MDLGVFMRMLTFKSVAALGAIALLSACTDETSASHSAETDNACLGAKVVAPSRAYFGNNVQLLIEEDGFVVKTFDGANFGLYIPEEAAIYTGDGQIFDQNVVLAALPLCPVNATYDPSTGEILVESSSSSAPGTSTPTSSDTPSSGTSSANNSSATPASSGNGPTSANPQSGASSSGSQPGQDQPVASSSSGTPAESSSSEIPLDANGFPTLESYGPPPAAYTKNILDNGKTGWNSRYWDACKPHCSWISNGQEGKTDTTTEESYQKGMTTARNCNIHDVEVPTFTRGSAVDTYWFGYEGTNNACQKGASGVFTCTDMAPIAVNDSLSYAYVAGPGSQTTCGKCFHLQYNGSFKSAGESNAPKATHQALKGKHIVVMTSNIGHDVEAGQFDLMVPGGGVGAFDALSTQVNGQGINWGAGFGGFLTECQNGMKCGYDSTLQCYQDCIKEMCDAAFGNAGFPNLLRGCHWFADWFMAADNPTYNWEEVECPQYLLDHYLTRINTTKTNNYKWRDDWSTYKQGDVLDTAICWKDGDNPHDPTGKGAGCEK